MSTKTSIQPDQLPPFDAESEAGALGCILTAEPHEAAAMLDQLDREDFYDHRNREIYSALRILRIDGKTLDLVALAQLLRDTGKTEAAGGFDYVQGLPDKAPSPAAFPTYLDTVEDRATRRAALRDAGELSRLATDTTIPAASIGNAARTLLEAHSRNGHDRDGLTVRSPDELLSMTFDDSDRILGDRILATGQSLVIAGAGSIGKSRLALQFAVATIIGQPFVGFETRQPALRWLILQAENSNRRLQADLASFRDWAGHAWQQVNERLAIHTLESDADGFLSLDNPDAQRRIADAIGNTKADIVVWDSLYNFGAGDLNADEAMGATLLAISRLTKAGNANRCPVILHHALTGKAGAIRATGYDRASFGRNSKVLHSWTRAQINIAPGSPDSNDLLVLSCGKCSNGKEFAPLAIRLDQGTMIYEPAQDFDLSAWQADLTGRADREPLMNPDRVRLLCEGSVTKSQLAKAIQDDCGCGRATAYRHVAKAERAKKIHWSKASDSYIAK